MDDLENLLRLMYEWAWTKEEFMVISTIGFCLVGAMWVLMWTASMRKRKGKGMGKVPHLAGEQARIIEDALVDGIETAYMLGLMSRKRRRYWYDRAGKSLGLNGLLRQNRVWKMLHPFKIAKLKSEIRARIGTHTPIKFPAEGETQPKLTVVHSVQRKLDEIFRRYAA